jgi:hypothetical protein
MAQHHHDDGVTADAHELRLLLVVRTPQCSDYSQFEALARASKFGVTGSTSSAELARLDGTVFSSLKGRVTLRQDRLAGWQSLLRRKHPANHGNLTKVSQLPDTWRTDPV